MSILDPITLTSDAAQQLAAQKITQNLRAMLNQIVRQYTTVYETIWEHPTLTPQQVCDGLGTNAAELFTLAAELKALLNTAKPDALTQVEPNEFTINSDGTVTVGAAIGGDGS